MLRKLSVQDPVWDGSENRAARKAGGSGHSRQRNHVGIDLGRIVVVHVARVVARPGNGGIRRVLVGPGGIAAGGVNDPVNRVRADEIPGVNRQAVVERIAGQARGIDGFDPAVGQAVGPAAVELRLVDVVAFFVFSGCTVRDSLDTGATGDSVAGGVRGGASTRS